MVKRRVPRGSSKRSVRARKQKRSARKKQKRSARRAAVGTRTKEGIAKPGKAAGIVEDAWAPSPFALWAQRWDDPSGSNPSAILLRHPTAPFVARGTEIDETSLRVIALHYLTHANFPPLGIQDWLDRLKQEDDPFFGWLPLSWPPKDFTDDNAGDPFVSFRIDAKSSDGTELADDTVVLLAGEKIIGVPSGSGHGIRVIAHTHTDKDGVEVRITGMSASLPPFVLDARNKSIRNEIASILRNKSARDTLRAEMARSAGLSDSSSVQIRGVRFVEVDGKQSVELRGTVGVTSSNPTPYSGVFLLQEGSLALVSKVDLVADPGRHRRLFDRSGFAGRAGGHCQAAADALARYAQHLSDPGAHNKRAECTLVLPHTCLPGGCGRRLSWLFLRGQRARAGNTEVG